MEGRITLRNATRTTVAVDAVRLSNAGLAEEHILLAIATNQVEMRKEEAGMTEAGAKVEGRHLDVTKGAIIRLNTGATVDLHHSGILLTKAATIRRINAALLTNSAPHHAPRLIRNRLVADEATTQGVTSADLFARALPERLFARPI